MYQSLFAVLLILLPLASTEASEYTIFPSNKANIFRNTGESVYVACKSKHALNTLCEFDCGNGKRFEGINGYCEYPAPGIFQLNALLKESNGTVFHTATVNVGNKKVDNIQNKHASEKKSRASAAYASASKDPVHGWNIHELETINSEKTLNIKASENSQQNLQVTTTFSNSLNSQSSIQSLANNINPFTTLIPEKDFDEIINKEISKQTKKNSNNPDKNTDENSSLLGNNINQLNSNVRGYGFTGESYPIENGINTVQFSNINQNLLQQK